MLDTITTTPNSVSSFVNRTSTLATTASLIFYYNATEFFNVTAANGNNTNRTKAFNACDGENPEFNCTIDEYLTYYLGAKQMPLETAIWVSFFLMKIKCLGAIQK